MITQLICLSLCLLLCAWFFHQTWFLSKEYKLTDLSNPLENDNNVSLQRAVGSTISMFSPSELKSLWPKCIVTFRGYAIFSYRAILLYLRLCILFFCHKKGWSIGGDTWLELSNISRLSALCCKVCTRVTLRIWVKCEEVKFDNTFMLKGTFLFWRFWRSTARFVLRVKRVFPYLCAFSVLSQFTIIQMLLWYGSQMTPIQHLSHPKYENE